MLGPAEFSYIPVHLLFEVMARLDLHFMTEPSLFKTGQGGASNDL